MLSKTGPAFAVSNAEPVRPAFRPLSPKAFIAETFLGSFLALHCNRCPLIYNTAIIPERTKDAMRLTADSFQLSRCWSLLNQQLIAGLYIY